MGKQNCPSDHNFIMLTNTIKLLFLIHDYIENIPSLGVFKAKLDEALSNPGLVRSAPDRGLEQDDL